MGGNRGEEEARDKGEVERDAIANKPSQVGDGSCAQVVGQARVMNGDVARSGSRPALFALFQRRVTLIFLLLQREGPYEATAQV